MSRLHEFLDAAGVFFLATVDGPQAKVRPLGAHVELDGKEYFAVGNFKAVYRQMCANPRVEIAAFAAKDGKWLRYTGTAVFAANPAVEERIFAAHPQLRNIYNDASGRKMMIFSLTEATAKITDMAGNEETL